MSVEGTSKNQLGPGQEVVESAPVLSRSYLMIFASSGAVNFL